MSSEIKVVGVTFDNHQENLGFIEALSDQDPIIVEIIPEPTNPFDRSALQIFAGTDPGDLLRVGYVPRKSISKVSKAMKEQCIFGLVIDFYKCFYAELIIL